MAAVRLWWYYREWWSNRSVRVPITITNESGVARTQTRIIEYTAHYVVVRVTHVVLLCASHASAEFLLRAKEQITFQSSLFVFIHARHFRRSGIQSTRHTARWWLYRRTFMRLSTVHTYTAVHIERFTDVNQFHIWNVVLVLTRFNGKLIGVDEIIRLIAF